MKHLFALVVALVAFSTPFAGCKTTPTNPDSFFNAVVTCTAANTSNPQAEAAVLACLTSAMNGDYAGCLSGLVAAGTWTVQEVACLVEHMVTVSATRLNAGKPAPSDDVALKNGNAWLTQEHITFRARSAP